MKNKNNVTKEESIRLHYDWWGQCRTCEFWQSADRKAPGLCGNLTSPLYNNETWTEGHCEKWDSFDIETALEFLQGDHI